MSGKKGGKKKGAAPSSSSPAPQSPGPSGAKDSPIRGRGGYRNEELNTIPAGISDVRVKVVPNGHREVELMTNFIKIKNMEERKIHNYRLDIEPEVESKMLRRRLLDFVLPQTFTKSGFEFDGGNDIRSLGELGQQVVEYEHTLEGVVYKLTLKKQPDMKWGGFEMVRLYNMRMRAYLKLMNYFVFDNQKRVFLNENTISRPIENLNIQLMRGFETAINVHEEQQLLLNLDSKQNLFQEDNCLELMNAKCKHIKDQSKMITEAQNMFEGARVMTKYNKRLYRVEEIDFKKKPTDSFGNEKTGGQNTYVRYFRERYNMEIKVEKQPLFRATLQGARRKQQPDQEERPIYLVPELCHLASLTKDQREDLKLKRQLADKCRLKPQDRVEHLQKFLKDFHEHKKVAENLKQWGYSYEKDALKVKGRIMPPPQVGLGKWANQKPGDWRQLNKAMFDPSEPLPTKPVIKKLAIVMPPIARPFSNRTNQGDVLAKLTEGLKAIGIFDLISQRSLYQLTGDNFHKHIKPQLEAREMDDCTLIIVFVQRKGDLQYSLVKKYLTQERGILSQVITYDLMSHNDDRRVTSASKKIAVQVAVKVGAEPWRLSLDGIDKDNTMFCGFDVTHEKGSYGAFTASLNSSFSRCFSQVDQQSDRKEVSLKMAQYIREACLKWKEHNKRYPKSIFLYRDGVGDGQIAEVFKDELEGILKEVKKLDSINPIKVSMIIVNKRIGARFYAHNKPQNPYENPAFGTVVDNVVTRPNRFDFYLIAHHATIGTATPTYYNIIKDENKLSAEQHQMLAYKLCFMYYNWSGPVRVPAPVQYSHKLALLCGDALKSSNIHPNLNTRLHFL